MIDANVIKGIFDEMLLDRHALTASPGSFLEECLAKSCRIVLDSGGHILQEWRDPVDQDWFENWFTALVSSANVAEIECGLHNALLKELRSKCGFPNRENSWLIRAAATAADEVGTCVLATEDMDFFEPKFKKSSAQRQAHLEGKKRGTVCKLLASHDVKVLALCRC